MILALFNPLNDITTTPVAPPAFIKQTVEYPTHAPERQAKLHPDLTPLLLDAPASLVYEKIHELATTRKGWQILHADSENLHLEAVATTSLMRFKDDLVIEVRPEPTGQSSVHMRSRSRVGKSDLGANAARIKAFLSDVHSVVSKSLNN